MSAGTLAPYAFPQAFDDNGDPLDGGLLYTYVSGTSTPAATYTSSDLTGPQNTNPIVLSAGGRYKIYLDAMSYKFILKDANGVVLDTTDPVGSVGLQAVIVSEFSFFGDPTSPIQNYTGYPVGTTYAFCHAGTTLMSLDSRSLEAGTYKLQGMIASLTGTLLEVGLMNLSDGADNVPLVTISTTSATGVLVQSSAITFATPGATKSYGIKAQIPSGSGFAWGLQMVKIA